MMRKWLGLGVLLSAALTGCTSEAPQVESPEVTEQVQEEVGVEDTEIGGTLTVVTSRTDAEVLFEQIEEDFKVIYPEVTDIIWESAPDYDQYIMTRMNTPEYGDVLFIPFGMSGQPELYPTFFEPLGTIEELEPLYIDVTEADYEGIAYGLPTSLDFLGIIYNENVFAEAGIEKIPTTIEEFLDAAQKIQDNTDTIPFYSKYGPAMGIWGGALSSFGGENYKAETLEAGTAFAKGQPIREIMDLFYTLASKGQIEPDPVTLNSGTAMQMVADGEIAMIIGGLQDMKVMEDLSDISTINTMPIPTQIDGKTSLAFGAAEVIGINANSTNKDTARAFLEFFISEQSNYSNQLGGMSPSKADLSPEVKAVFDNSQIVLTAPPTDAIVDTQYTAIANQVGVARLADVLQKVVNMGLYPDQYETYETYIVSLEESWAKAVADNQLSNE